MSHDTTTTAAADVMEPITSRSIVQRIATQLRVIRDGATDQSRAQRDAVTAFLVRVASAGLLYLSQIILARWMGGHEYGIYVFVWTWVLVLGGLSHLGLNLAVIRLVPQYVTQGRHDLLRGLLRGGRLATVAISTVIATLGMAALFPLQPYLENHFVLPLYLGLVCLPLFTLTDVQDGIGRGFGWMSVALAPPYILRPLLLLVAMSIAYAAGLQMTATTAAGAAIAATWLTGIVQTVLVNRRIEAAVASGERRYTYGAWFKFSFPLLVIGMADIVTQNADVLVVSRYMSPADVGIYFAAAKTMSLIMFVHFAVGSAVAHRFSALDASGDRAGLEAFVRDAVSWTFWPSLACALAILALGKPLLWLFGPQFTAGYPVMFILVVGFLVRSAMGPSEFLLNMLGEQRRAALVLMGTALLSVALNFLLVPRFGMIGAASATATALIVASALNYVVVRRRLGLEIGIWHNLRRGRH